METEQLKYKDPASADNMPAIEGTNPQNLPVLPPAQTSENQWQQFSKTIADIWQEFPIYLERFFNVYKQPLLTLAWIFTAIITVKVIVAILDAINDIPLAQPLFELIGIIYTAWFTFRYLLKSSTRQELVGEIDSLKRQIVG